MALADIITAIKAQADAEIAQIQQSATHKKDDIKKQNDEDLHAFTEDAKRQTAAKKEQMKKKAKTMVEMERRKILLQEKRRELDSIYDSVIIELKKLPDAKKEELEKALENKVQGRKGEKKSVSEGGFIFVSENTEEDFTFPHLVQSMLRPQTEMEVSAKLFS